MNEHEIIEQDLRSLALTMEQDDSYFCTEVIKSVGSDKHRYLNSIETIIGEGLMRLSSGRRFFYIVDFVGAVILEARSERVDGRKARCYKIAFDTSRNHFRDDRHIFDVCFVSANTYDIPKEQLAMIPMKIVSTERVTNIADLCSIEIKVESNTQDVGTLYMSGIDVIVR